MSESPSALAGRVASLVLTLALAAASAALAIGDRRYGWSLFVSIPFFIGFFPTTLLRISGVKPWRECLRAAVATASFLSLGFLLLRAEGIICIALAVPLALPVVILGAYMGYLLLHKRATISPFAGATLVVIALAMSLLAEKTKREAPTYVVSNSVDIAAPPAIVWSSLIHMGQLGQPTDLLFKLGVACPQRVDIYGNGVGAVRVCTLTTGQLHERITAWQPERRLAWQSISTPAPLQELNPFGKTDPPHLHGFYRSVGGEFELIPLGSDSTRVTRSSSYQHNLYPAYYWKLWCDYVARRGHIHVLNVLREDAERGVRVAFDAR